MTATRTFAVRTRPARSPPRWSATASSPHRRGKFMWLETDDGPVLGLHLGMAGSIALDGPGETPRWDRFTVEFDDGTRFALRDKRRLGRAVLNPDFSHVGPDAADVGRDEFRRRGRRRPRADQGPAARSGCDLGGRQPARRPGPVAGPDRPGPSLRSCPTRILTGCGASCARRSARPSARAAPIPGVRRRRGREGALPARRHAAVAGAVGGRTTYWCPTCQT